MKEKEANQMPFGQTFRIGNFKLWRGHQRVKTISGNDEVECLFVTDLSGAWGIRIPVTYSMYGTIVEGFADSRSDDADISKKATNAVSVILSNMMYVSSVNNGFYHHAVEIVSYLYAFPDLLKEDNPNHQKFLDDVRQLTKDYLEWRKTYDEAMKAHEPTEEDDRHDDLAEEAAKVVSLGE